MPSRHACRGEQLANRLPAASRQRKPVAGLERAHNEGTDDVQRHAGRGGHTRRGARRANQVIAEPHRTRDRQRHLAWSTGDPLFGDEYATIDGHASTGDLDRTAAPVCEVDAPRDPCGLDRQTRIAQQTPDQQPRDRGGFGHERGGSQPIAIGAALPRRIDDTVEDLAFVTELIGEPRDSTCGTPMDALQRGQQLVSDARAREPHIGVAGILDHRDGPFGAPRAGLLGRHTQQWPDQVTVDRGHPQRARTPGPARETEQHRLGLVARRMAGRDPVKVVPMRDTSRGGQPPVACTLLQPRPVRQLKPLDPNGKAELGGVRGDRIRLGGRVTTHTVIDRQHAHTPGNNRHQQMQQTHRVGATRDQREHPRICADHAMASDVVGDPEHEDITHAGSLPASVALHLQTTPADQAERALCPGDPDRARLVAHELMDGAREVTSARGLLGFTGTYRGVPVTVQTTGMGGGSTGIVVHELIELGARLLVRAGTTGGLQENLAPGSLIVADSAVADDGAGLAMTGGVAPPPDPALTEALASAAAASGRQVSRGTIVSSDVFYDLEEGRNAGWQARGILGVEMEAAVLFALAARHGARAGCVLTVSNQLVGANPGWLESNERERAGVDACRVALDALTNV